MGDVYCIQRRQLYRSEREDWCARTDGTGMAQRVRRLAMDSVCNARTTHCVVTRDGVIRHTLFGNSPSPCLAANRPDISLSPSTNTMPIAPITGKLRKRFWLDLGCAFGLGVSAGYAYWCVLRVFPAFTLLTRSAGMVFTSRLVCKTRHPYFLFL